MFIMKAFSGIGGFIILLIGIGMLGVTIWAMKNSALTFDNYTFLGILLAADFVIIGAAIIGICGVRRASGPMICIFQIFVLIFFLVFGALGIVSEVSPRYLFDGNCTDSPSNQYIKVASDAYDLSKGLCSACPCGLTDDAISSGNYTALQRAQLSLLIRTSNGPVRFQDCQAASILNDTYHEVFSILNSIEYILDCGGWCENSATLLYKFSDVNRGKPKQACYPIMKETTEKYAGIVGIAALAVAGFMALVCICNLCLCFSPDRRSMRMKDRLIVRDQNGNYYQPA